ncbi:AMP-dependent synthetase/ligase [Penicillium atrosanguineum]|uniref:AMP-dependent synthetase/ligase n=1 Tax=Penicillium atrosanguineum TaxID=1132637 RepID=A0A9W9U8S9_9EURO|nr:AMP-dependent synthetase/ligase [Penicillium atrosanguineum]
MRVYSGFFRALRVRSHSVPTGLFLRRTSSHDASISSLRRGLLTASIARGPSEPPLIESTVGGHFSKIVAQYGDRLAVISKHQNDRVTYSGLDTRSNALARGLESVGVKKGDRVGVMLGNSMEFAVATYALFKLGAILVPLNLSFNAMQVVAALSHLETSHLIISAESNLPRKDPRSNVPLLEHLIPNLSNPEVQSALVPSLRQVIFVDNSSGRVVSSAYKSLTPFSSIMSHIPADGCALPEQTLSPDDILNIQFTSGTTAMPKAACLSHRSILNNGSQIGDRMLLTPSDIVCCPPPLFHCFGSILGYMATATHGSAIVFPTESFNARAALKAIQEEKCTALYGVPTMFLEELSLIGSGEVPSEGFEHLRTGIAAGSSIPSELMKKLHRVLNLTELTICYGMTETSPVSLMTTTDDPIDRRINTVGRLMPHVEAKIVNPSNKKEVVPIDTRGELAVSGYLLMKEYWADPEKTAEVMIADDNGKVWMHTGDEASMSPDGYVTITGRIKDLIIRGGENIHPLEIENCLLGNSSVGDVSIVGVPDERYGEVVAAFVIAREHGPKSITAKEIQEWVREKLSSHLVPKYVFFLGPLDTFPKTASGKIQKFKLKEQVLKLLAEGK